MSAMPPSGTYVKWGEEEAIVVTHEDGHAGRKSPRLVLYITRTGDLISLPPTTEVKRIPPPV
jgi:hypothetical protein